MTYCSVRFRAELEVSAETSALLMIEAPNTSEQTVFEQALFAPVGIELEPFLDHYGNPSRRGVIPAGYAQVEYRAFVETNLKTGVAGPSDAAADAPSDLPPETLHFLLPSRYCPSDQLDTVAQDLFGLEGGAYERVQNIVEWIHDKVKYESGSSDTDTTAVNTFVARAGVCRDFAHLTISFCRALNIPARYMSGYCLGLEPPDLHAYVQAYVNGQWVCFDATAPAPRPALIQIGVGRDAADCAWSTFYGTGKTNWMGVEVAEAEPPAVR